MNDYISRQAAIEELWKYAREETEDDNGISLCVIEKAIENVIEKIEKSDVVEVVRCKNCVYRPCKMMPYSSDNDYCSYGERADK